MGRKYELDWFRVILFALLVPFHAALGFIDTGENTYLFLNDELAGDGLLLFVFWSHGWRLPSLFLISGIGTWFLTSRGVGLRFISQRMARLLVPLVFGTACINVFAGFAIAQALDADLSLLSFWRYWLTDPRPTYIMHLWFLLYLALFTLLCWPLFAVRAKVQTLVPPPAALVPALMALSVLVSLVLKPIESPAAGNAYLFVYYLTFFFGGYLVGADHERIVDFAKRYAWGLLGAGIATFALKTLLLVIAMGVDPVLGVTIRNGGWGISGETPPNAVAFILLDGANAWVWCLAALGFVSRHLTRPSAILSQLNRGIFPLYVLHFAITLVGLAIASKVAAPWWIEFIATILFVYATVWLIWLAVDRLGPVSYLIGGRPAKSADGPD